MKEKTTIKHKIKDKGYCTETLYVEFWGGEDFRLTCYKCGFAHTVHKSIFEDWLKCSEAKIF